MGVTAKRTFAVTVGALGMALVAMSVAWACTANRHMEASHSEVVPGMALTVSNVQWVAKGPGHTAFSGNQVEVRLGVPDPSLRPEVNRDRAQVLGTAPIAEDGTFSATVRIPANAASGNYLVYAIADVARANAANGNPPDTAILPVRVGGSQPETVERTPGASQPAPVENTTPAEPTTPVEDTTPATGTAPAPAGEQTPAPGASAPAPTSAAPAPAPAATAPVRELVHANVATQPEARVPAALTNGVAEAASPDTAVPAALTNGYVAPTSEAPVQATSSVPNQAEAPIDSTAPTSGFASPERSGYEWAGAPETSGANPGVGAGLALLSGGMVLLLAGFTLATLSRRREKAKVTGS